MAYTVLINGVPIQCETAEEAVELARLHSGGPRDSRENGEPSSQNVFGGSRWTESRTAAFMAAIKSQQKKLIDSLLDHPDGRTDQQLLQLLGLQDNRALAGVFTGLWKNARKVGANPDDLYVRDTVTIGDRDMYEYKASESFRRAAKAWREANKK